MNALLHRCGERQEPACPHTSLCATWTWLPTTNVASRWSRTGSLCGTGHNWRSTRRWCRLYDATVLPGFVQQAMTERSWYVDGKKEPVPNCREREGGLDWWSSLRKWASGGVAQLQSSWLRWPMPKPRLLFHPAEQGQSCLHSQVECSSRMLGGPSVHSILVGPARRGWLGWRRAISA